MDLATALGTGYEIQWRGRTLKLGYLTLGVMARFANWLKKNAEANFRDLEDPELKASLKTAFTQGVLLGEFDVGGILWRKAVQSPSGMVKLVQFMAKPLEGAPLTEEDAAALIEEKLEEMAGIYNLAIDESLGPKAKWRTETR